MQSDFFRKNLKTAALSTLPVILFAVLYHLFKPEDAPVAWRSGTLEFLLILLTPIALFKVNWDPQITPLRDRFVWSLMATVSVTLIWWLLFSLCLAVLLSVVHN